MLPGPPAARVAWRLIIIIAMSPTSASRSCGAATATPSSAGRGADPPPAQGRQEDGARAAGAPARSRLLPRARPLRRPPDHDFGMAEQRIPATASSPAPGVSTAAPVRLRAGLHRVRRLALRGVRAQDLQDHGPRDEDRRPVIGLNDSGGPHPGRRRLARRLRDIFLRNTWPRASSRRSRRFWDRARRRRVFTGDHRLRVHGQEHLVHVRDRSRRHQAVTHEGVTAEDLGGATTHGTTSGVAHFAADSEEECLALIRELVTFLPQNNMEDPPLRPTQDPADRRDEALQSIVPAQPNKPYDMKEILRSVLDDRYFFEVQASYARTSSWASAARRPARRHRGQPARAPRGLPRHRGSLKARASCASATASTCRW